MPVKMRPSDEMAAEATWCKTVTGMEFIVSVAASTRVWREGTEWGVDVLILGFWVTRSKAEVLSAGRNTLICREAGRRVIMSHP